MILDKFILSFNEGKLVSFQDLAKKIDVDEVFIKGALEQLRVMGYLKTNKSPCLDNNTKCISCSGCSASKKINSIVIWELTEKGMKYAKIRKLELKTPGNS